MKPDRYTGLRVNDVGVDEGGRHTVVINCKCTLPHDSQAAYRASHADGCLLRPSEGLVLVMDGDRVTGWDCQDVFDRTLAPVGAAKAADLKQQMDDRLEADRRMTKARNFGGRHGRAARLR